MERDQSDPTADSDVKSVGSYLTTRPYRAVQPKARFGLSTLRRRIGLENNMNILSVSQKWICKLLRDPLIAQFATPYVIPRDEIIKLFLVRRLSQNSLPIRFGATARLL